MSNLTILIEENTKLHERVDYLESTRKGLEVKCTKLEAAKAKMNYQYSQECKHLNHKIQRDAKKIAELTKKIEELQFFKDAHKNIW